MEAHATIRTDQEVRHEIVKCPPVPDGPLAEVSRSSAVVLALGLRESIHVHVGIKMPAAPTQRGIEEVDRFARQWVERKLDREIQQYAADRDIQQGFRGSR